MRNLNYNRPLTRREIRDLYSIGIALIIVTFILLII